MKKNKRGFTLIELLVVVLIIGILAAVAVPQYQKAVAKSRAAEAMIMLKAIGQAQEVYYLANNEYTADITKLDVEVPGELIITPKASYPENKYAYYCIATDGGSAYCEAVSSTANLPGFNIMGGHVWGGLKPLAGKMFCFLHEGKNDTAKSICQNMGSLDTSLTDSWFVGNYFRLN